MKWLVTSEAEMFGHIISVIHSTSGQDAALTHLSRIAKHKALYRLVLRVKPYTVATQLKGFAYIMKIGRGEN